MQFGYQRALKLTYVSAEESQHQEVSIVWNRSVGLDCDWQKYSVIASRKRRWERARACALERENNESDADREQGKTQSER